MNFELIKPIASNFVTYWLAARIDSKEAKSAIKFCSGGVATRWGLSYHLYFENRVKQSYCENSILNLSVVLGDDYDHS
jgi:hypothetical protein